MQRVQQVCIRTMGLVDCRNALLSYRILRIVRIYKAKIVWSYGHPDGLERLADTFLLLFGELYVFFKLLQSLNPVSYLPFPVVPLGIGNLRKKFFSS